MSVVFEKRKKDIDGVIPLNSFNAIGRSFEKPVASTSTVAQVLVGCSAGRGFVPVALSSLKGDLSFDVDTANGKLDVSLNSQTAFVDLTDPGVAPGAELPLAEGVIFMTAQTADMTSDPLRKLVGILPDTMRAGDELKLVLGMWGGKSWSGHRPSIDFNGCSVVAGATTFDQRMTFQGATSLTLTLMDKSKKLFVVTQVVCTEDVLFA